MAIDPRTLRPKPSGPAQDPPVQLKAESGDVLTTESGQQLTTE